METDVLQQRRIERKVQTYFDRHHDALKKRTPDGLEIYKKIGEYLITNYNHDYSRIVELIHLKMQWPLAFKRLLLKWIKRDLTKQGFGVSTLTNFISHPEKEIQTKITKKGNFSWLTFPTIESVDRQFNSAVSSVVRLQSNFFFMNLFTLIIWLVSIVIPFEVLSSSSSFSNISFDFGSIFTSEGYLSETMLFQGFYPNITLRERYDLPLIYLITSYVYYFVWFIFLTFYFAQAYRKKVLRSILIKNESDGFKLTFTRYNYTNRTENSTKKNQDFFKQQFLNFMKDDERHRRVETQHFNKLSYKFKLIVTNLFYIVLGLALGALNWFLLSGCGNPGVNCYQSILVLVLVNRFLPYLMVCLNQMEEYKYQSYKIDVIGFRSIYVYMCTILSFVIYFFTHSPTCYETAFGQFIYLLSLAETLASLVIPFLFGFLFDLISLKAGANFDGINVHVQLSPPTLLYAQFLIWIGVYFAPLVQILMLINMIFSFISHRLYLFIRSKLSGSTVRVLSWSAERLQYIFYLMAYILLIFSVTCFTVFTTQLSPSESCGPFQSLNHAYDVISNYLGKYQTSVLWISIIDYLTSPGLIYFLGILFFFIGFKFRQEGQAEKELVFIRQNNLESKKNIRKAAVKKLLEQTPEVPIQTVQSKDRKETSDIDDDNVNLVSEF